MNKVSNYIPNLHIQSTSLKTFRICRQLREANGDVAVVIESIGKRFCKQSSDSSNTTQPKAKDRKDLLYTTENIEKEHKVYSAAVHGRINFESAYELYRYSLKLVLHYCQENSAMSDYQRFCLHFFLGCLYSRLPELGFALVAAENYAKAFTCAAKLQELDSNAVSECLCKHRAIFIFGNVRYYDVSIEDALLFTTYVDRKVYQRFSPDSLEGLSDTKIRSNQDLSICALNDLPQLFTSIGCTKFSKLVLTVNALDALSHNRFKILFVDEMTNKTSAGAYNHKNTVRVLVSQGREKIRCALFHELMHKAMNRVFDHWCIPYYKNDVNAKKAYRESMKHVLLNLINFSGVSGDIDINKLAFNELVQFCFGTKLVINGIKEKSYPYVLDLFKDLRIVFDEGYSVSELDVEFITNALNYLINVENGSAYARCVQPLLDYIDKFVIPPMEKYINGHPSKNRLQLKG